jgi:hypothetical protein
VVVSPVAVRAQWAEQDPAKPAVVEGVVLVGFGRELAALVALRPGQAETFSRGADHLAAPGAQEQRELVGPLTLATERGG